MRDELCFSAFNRRDGETIPEYERKTDDPYEAEMIWAKLGFQGETVRLGEVRKKILLETPFVYHARALKILEESLRIVHVQADGPKKRQMGSFCAAYTPCSIYQGDSDRKTYGNDWLVTFSTEQIQRQNATFFANPRENKRSFMPWLERKLKAMVEGVEGGDGARVVSIEELQKSIPKKDKKPRATDTMLHEVLKEMITEGIVAEIEPQEIKRVGNRSFRLN